ncbi:cytochrome P450 (plasmid) [Nocardia sp. NBC_01377]|uniref:cytochrome P450 n=1 Tax=Nocardia sp. NBC_01377 TaxID=2903595 RepID=UPI003250159E
MLAEDRYRLYTEKFVADPHAAYEQMRRKFGTMAPVDLAPGVPATLVLGHATAVRILNDPHHFPADPRTWQETIPQDCPVRPMMGYLPAARNSDGTEHARLRRASVAGIEGIDLYTVDLLVAKHAVPLINAFSEQGSADVVSQYAFPLVLHVLNEMVGCPEEIGERVAAGMAARFEGDPGGMAILKETLMELITLKRSNPGNDVTSRLAQDSGALTPVEIFAQLMSFYGAGFEAQRNLITNALLLLITDDRFRSGQVLGRNLSTSDAIDEVLFNDPPMANFCTTYPRQPISIDGTWLPPHQPVVISLAACNNDPAIRGSRHGGDSSIGNRSHLAWSSGPHVCPAKNVAYATVQSAIDQLLDALPDLQLAITPAELVWRPGPFHRAMSEMPVRFPNTAPMAIV